MGEFLLPFDNKLRKFGNPTTRFKAPILMTLAVKFHPPITINNVSNPTPRAHIEQERMKITFSG